MSEVQLPATSEILRVCDLLDEAVTRYLDARETLTEGWGRYEADAEAHVQVNLVLRYVEGVITLARTDLVLYPSAVVLGRAALETAIRMFWLLAADDPFDREVRWLALLRGAEKYLDDYDRGLSEIGIDASNLARKRDAIQDFRLKVTALLPPGHDLIERLPSLEQMLKSLGRRDLYVAYRYASQFAHASLMGTEIYRQRLGTSKEWGEFLSPADWAGPLQWCWFALQTSCVRFLQLIKADLRIFAGEEFSAKVQRALNEVVSAR